MQSDIITTSLLIAKQRPFVTDSRNSTFGARKPANQGAVRSVTFGAVIEIPVRRAYYAINAFLAE
jgi:hypothetical protein